MVRHIVVILFSVANSSTGKTLFPEAILYFLSHLRISLICWTSHYLSFRRPLIQIFGSAFQQNPTSLFLHVSLTWNTFHDTVVYPLLCYAIGCQYIGFLYFVIYMMRRACGFDVTKVERISVVHELNCYWTKSSVSGIITIIGICGCGIFLMLLVLFVVLINML